ncbi:gamma-glutamyltransferase [Fodinicurvata sediminis]|uniref:gamma-glutamyltransferase n=1 Tax=Fodinicurvata sediminis TaxID=1121832 RepID=UPI0003B62E3F|nr:gamma-glutamyltransferase [Fodinicurvata sediminis]
MKPSVLLALPLLAGLLLGAPALAQDRPAPEVATGESVKQLVRTDSYMVSAADPRAVEAGVAMLEDGGSALDALVATQMMLGLVEPQSSGLGGGAFLVYYDNETEELTTLEGRETAPSAADGTLFLDERGQPLPFWEAVVGGRSVGTPGIPALMQAAHERWGRLPWADLFAPAIDQAREGFAVGPRLAGMLEADTAARLRSYPAARDYFFPGGTALKEGQIRDNPQLAETLSALARESAKAFYTGPIAEEIVRTVQSVPDTPGLLSQQDLADYEVKERPPVCHPYRTYRVCGMGPPSSGALTVGQILGLLEHFNLAGMDPASARPWHLFAEAGKLAFADRNRYIADSDYVDVPVRGLLDPAYLTARAQLISQDKAMDTPAQPGNPPWHEGPRPGRDGSRELPGTSHISIVDAEGNVASMTTTIESAFGSQLMTGGFLLNNELTDFSFEAEDETGRRVANRVQPGKRPRSSMAPTIVFDGEENPVLAVGSPGGVRIIPYVAQAIMGFVDWELDAQQITRLAHVSNMNGTTWLEANTQAENWQQKLEGLGHEVEVSAHTSGLQTIVLSRDGLSGGADPRRDGTAGGK